MNARTLVLIEFLELLFNELPLRVLLIVVLDVVVLTIKLAGIVVILKVLLSFFSWLCSFSSITGLPTVNVSAKVMDKFTYLFKAIKHFVHFVYVCLHIVFFIS
jgi:hypothetical protein